MATRVVLGGRAVFASRDFRPRTTPDFRGQDGEPVDLSPIPSSSPESPMRAGETFVDEDDVAVRVVRALDVREGWAPLGFWLRRYDVGVEVLARWCRLGVFDAAVEASSPTRWFRCRDESRVPLGKTSAARPR